MKKINQHFIKKAAPEIEIRITERDGISRGDELAAVLLLASQFPSDVDKELKYPVLAQVIKANAKNSEKNQLLEPAVTGLSSL
jgi:hypothetical protein